VVPPRVQRALRRHLAALPREVVRLVQTVAAAGIEGTLGAVAADAAVDELDLVDALGHVDDGRLVHIDRDGGGYRFVHELARRVAAGAA
jgi:hypothetical protein